jgi:outer membrane protein assembly factor BamB
VAALLAGAAPLTAADWPTYRHDNQRSGITQETLEWPLQLLWTFQSSQPPAPAWPEPAKRDYYLSPGSQRPLKPRVTFDRAFQVAAAGNGLYFGSSSEHTIQRIDLPGGRTNWTFFTDAPVRMAPAVDQNTAAGTNHYLIPNDGRFVSPFGVRTGVAVEQGLAYFGAGFFPSEGVYLCAVNALTGAEQWRRRLVNEVAFQGYLLLSSTRIYMPGSRANPFFFDRTTGSLLGRYADRGAMGTFALLSANSIVYGPAARGGAGLAEQGLSGDALATYEGNSMVVTANRSYLLTDTTLSALDRASRAQLWLTATTHPYELILAGSALIAGGNDQVAAFDAATGTRLWTAPVEGRAYGLAVADGKLFVSTDRGMIHCFVQDQSRKQSTWMLF